MRGAPRPANVQPMATAAATKWVYDFVEGSREMRDLLGGKGANVAEMTRVLGPELVPAGFTISTAACVAYMRSGGVSPRGSMTPSRRRSAGSRRRPGAGWATPPTRCSSPSAAAPATRCPA